MSDRPAKVYEFDSLAHYGWSDRFRIRLADIVFFLAIKIIGSTIRWETDGTHHVMSVLDDGKIPIFCLWHNRIFASTYFLRGSGIVVITSQSLDGEYIARFLKRFGYGTVRGSSTRGGLKALVETIQCLRAGMPVALTVDGPRGPRYTAKKGAVVVANKTGNPMLPISVDLEHYWTVGSWDQMQIPKPFTRARLIVNSPIYVATHDDDEAKLEELQNSLGRLVMAPNGNYDA